MDRMRQDLPLLHGRGGPAPTTQVCYQCEVRQPVEAYKIRSLVTGRRHATCKRCQARRQRERRAMAPAERRASRTLPRESRIKIPELTPTRLPGALCQEVGTDPWFPEPGEDGKAAKAICYRCPVRADCLLAGLEQDDEFRNGIWGGFSGRERAALMRGRDE